MITAIALDDEPLALRVIQNYCMESDGIDLLETFVHPEEAADFLKKKKVDVIFLDINMPSVNGLRFSTLLPPDTQVIFTTAYSNFAIDGFNLNATDYLLKPFSFERFEQAINKVSERVFRAGAQSSESVKILLRVNYKLRPVAVDDILYIESFGDYLKIHLQDQPFIEVRFTLKEILLKLPATEFIQIHKSFIVSRKMITSFSRKSVELTTISIPVGRSYAGSINTIMGEGM